MHPFDLVPPALEQGLRPLEALARGAILPKEAPYTQARALLLAAMERYSVALSQQLSTALSSQDVRRDLALLRRIDARQAATLSALRPPDKEGDCQRAILLAMLSLELAAVLAQRLGEGTVRQALHFALPEFLDEIYRLANLLMLTEGKQAQQLLAGYVEIMPGRPLIACHRHPYDEVRAPAVPAGILEELSPLLLCAVAEEKQCFLLHAANRAEDGLARGLYLELSLLAEQHETLFASLVDQREPLDRLLLCQYAESYLYDSCAREEEIASLRQLYLEERDHELAHIRKLSDLCARENGNAPALPDFPDRLRLGPNKGYVRDALQNVGITSLRESYVPVGTLPQGADFFRYQQRVCPQAEQVPSHQVAAQVIEKTGEDYRFEIALHPVEALRNRQKDNTQVGR